jgi:transcriptional regulator PpsR
MPNVNLIEPDVTLRLDSHGVIKGAAGSTAVKGETLESWVGRPWADTVVAASGEHVRRVIEDAGASGASILLQLKQCFPSGREVLMEYTTVRLGDGSDLLAVGKNLQAVTELQAKLQEAQREREQHSWKSRDLETRYRLLFDASHEALTLLDAKSLHVVEVNPAGVRELNLASGDDFLAGMAPKEQKRLRGMFRRVRDYGRSPRILVHLGPTRSLWGVRASLLPAEPEQLLMVQLAPIEEFRPGADARGQEQRAPFSIDGLMERFPEGFVVVDAQGVVERANRAFVDLTQTKSDSSLLGDPIGRWLAHPGADAATLLTTLAEKRVVQDFAAKLRTDGDGEVDVLVTGVASAEGPHQHFGLMIKAIGNRLASDDDHWRLHRVTQALAESGGKTTLPMLVKESSEMLERRFIEAALKLRNGNRTAAAELLGISRQSLHLKLNRYASPSGSSDVE